MSTSRPPAVRAAVAGCRVRQEWKLFAARFVNTRPTAGLVKEVEKRVLFNLFGLTDGGSHKGIYLKMC